MPHLQGYLLRPSGYHRCRSHQIALERAQQPTLTALHHSASLFSLRRAFCIHSIRNQRLTNDYGVNPNSNL
jgi:hypothetical protein